MFGFCDESPEANPHNPIFCGVFSPSPCCELRGGRMGQIAKTTLEFSGSSYASDLLTEAAEFPTERPEGRPAVSHGTGTAMPLCAESRCELCSLFHFPWSGCAFRDHAAQSAA